MDKKSQKFTTIDEQIEILKSRKLAFDSIEISKHLLSTYGYYNIINGYKEPYVEKQGGSEIYRPGTTFEQIFSLFCFDHAIRNSVILTMIDLEEHLKSIVSYVIADNFSSNHTEYLKRENYRDRRVKFSRFSLDSILNSMWKTLNENNNNPIKYFRDTYDNVPPWILLKGVYFGTLVNFIHLQKKKAKEEIITLAYGFDKSKAEFDAVKNLFMDTLYICLEYRNLTAHGGRVFNYVPKSSIQKSADSANILSSIMGNFESIENSYGLSHLEYLLALFTHKNMSKHIEKVVLAETIRHCREYPQDLEFLNKSTGFNFKYKQ